MFTTNKWTKLQNKFIFISLTYWIVDSNHEWNEFNDKLFQMESNLLKKHHDQDCPYWIQYKTQSLNAKETLDNRVTTLMIIFL